MQREHHLPKKNIPGTLSAAIRPGHGVLRDYRSGSARRVFMARHNTRTPPMCHGGGGSGSRCHRPLLLRFARFARTRTRQLLLQLPTASAFSLLVPFRRKMTYRRDGQTGRQHNHECQHEHAHEHEQENTRASILHGQKVPIASRLATLEVIYLLTVCVTKRKAKGSRWTDPMCFRYTLSRVRA